MAGNPLQRLFSLGEVGSMPDHQLLDLFLSRRDETAETAFQELVSRHGPMVLRVCHSLLRDSHDAEDAFQAVFLVLANRADTIRNGRSIANWLFGVAHRVAVRARRSAARRRHLDAQVAERPTREVAPDEDGPDWQILHEEINGLPERLRAPIVHCYLQGLTYSAAAHRLGLSEVAVRGRLARARERLRRRLTHRGVIIPAGLLVAGAAADLQAAVSTSLVHSTARVAMGFAAGNTAAALAQGVLNAMLLHKIKAAAAVLLLGLGSASWAWHTTAGAADEPGQDGGGGTIPAPSVPAKRPALKKAAPNRGGTYPITITGRAVDFDGKPIAGAHIYLASRKVAHKRIAETISDAEGRYILRDVELPIEPAKPNEIGGRDVGAFQLFGQAEGFGYAWRISKAFYPQPRPANITYQPQSGIPLSHYEANDEIDLDLRFSRPSRLSGTIVDDAGKPLAGVGLEIRDCESLIEVDNIIGLSFDALNERDSAPPSMKIRTTDDAGRFVFEGLPEDCRFRIQVRAKGFPDRWVYAATSREPQPDHDRSPVFTGDFKLTLAVPVDVPIKVVYADTGQPAPKVAVSLGAGLVSTLGTTDDQGQVSLGVPPGDYYLQILPARGTPYLITEDKLAVETNPPVVLRWFYLRPAAIVEVTVVDANTGVGLADVDLWRRKGDGPQRDGVFSRSWEAATRIAWVDHPRTDAHGKLRALVEPGRHRLGVFWQTFPSQYVVVKPEGQDVDCRAGETVSIKFAMRRR